MSGTITSPRLGQLTPAQFQAALDRFGLGEFIRAQTVPFGLFGQNVFLTSAQGEFVLRGLPHYDWQFPHERFMARLLHDHASVPVPWPYHLDATLDIFGWSYVIMPRLPGLQLADPEIIARLTLADRLGIARALGENLARMHALTWSHAGRYDLATDTIQPFTSSYHDWTIDEIRRRMARASRASDQTTEEDIIWGEDIIARAQTAPIPTEDTCLVMNDYKEGNVVVERTHRSGSGWRVSGVFDLMEAHFGDRVMDLCRQIALYLEEGQPRLASAFVQAYTERRPLPPEASAWFPLFMLRDRLIIWTYMQEHQPTAWRSRRSLRQWAAPFLTFALVNG